MAPRPAQQGRRSQDSSRPIAQAQHDVEAVGGKLFVVTEDDRDSGPIWFGPHGSRLTGSVAFERGQGTLDSLGSEPAVRTGENMINVHAHAFAVVPANSHARYAPVPRFREDRGFDRVSCAR
jgi:hypothetical protein